MSTSVFIVSEWLAVPGKEQALLETFKQVISLTKQETGCVSARATKQITHPGVPGISTYPIVLLQEYVDLAAFDYHCEQAYVKQFFQEHIDNSEHSLVADWRCRLFTEAE